MDRGRKIVEWNLRTEADFGITGKHQCIHHPHDVVSTRFAHLGTGIVEPCIKFRGAQKPCRGLRRHTRLRTKPNRDDQPQNGEVRKATTPQCV